MTHNTLSEEWLRHRVSRRSFVAGGLALLAAPTVPIIGQPRQDPRFPGPPFSLGVASGDPSPDGVVLWTRLAPVPLDGGGMPDESVEVAWTVARDERMTQVVQSGTVVATPELGHSVHVEVTGLEPDRWYWYRFRSGGEVSRVGRTRTFPAPGAPVSQMRLAFVSCQHYETGFFTAYRHMLEDDLDLVVHLGDYIYEYEGRDGRARKHTGDEIELLGDYRNRYALYKMDPDLQAAHARFPFVVTWDDHEVDNNYAADVSEDDLPAELFLRRRAEAYQAYFEHMPLRRAAQPAGSRMQLYRQLSFGDLASFFVLDTRQYRTDQPCGDRSGPSCAGVVAPEATLLGDEQELWLTDGLDRSSSRWNVLPQQVMMARVDRAPGDEERISMDQWSGYEAARRRLMEFLATRRPANPVVLTGDIHTNWVNDLKVDYADEAAPVVATEFVGTSITSGGDGSDVRDGTAGMLSENPWVQFFNNQRGYVRCAITPQTWTADYQVVEYVAHQGSPISTRASFVVEAGRPGARRV
jgi:alkaline phosphatase D